MQNELFIFQKNALTGAITEPLCDEYRHYWSKAKTKEELVSLSLRQQSIPYFAHHCYKGKGLSKQYLIKEFADYINGYAIHDADGVDGYTYGLYVDYDYTNDLTVDKDVIHVMHTVGANIVIPKSKCPTIYISNRSNVHLVCEGYNSVKIYLFDKSQITIQECDADSNVTIYKYGDLCKVEIGKYSIGSIKTHEKQIKL